MEYSHSSSSFAPRPPLGVTVAALSQAPVPGAGQACTAIAAMTCAGFVAPFFDQPPMVTPDRMELWIRQGAAVYAAWRRLQHQQQEAYAHAKEIVDLLSPALPICAGDEHGGLLHDALGEALQLLSTPNSAAILTIGALSMALLKGGTELFDSHPQHDHNNCAVHIRFASQDELLAYLLNRFNCVEFSLCVIRKRFHHVPAAYPKQELAFKRAASLPPGLFYIFAHDVKKGTGTKEYLVAGLEDFYQYYKNLEPAFRAHYDVARENWPVTFYMDLEFELFKQNQHCKGGSMLEALIKRVAQQWAEDHGIDVDAIMTGFVVTDASNVPLVFERESGSEILEEAESGGEGPEPMDLEKEDEVVVVVAEEAKKNKKKLLKVSFHVHNQSMWFAGGVTAVCEFMQYIIDQLAAEDDKTFTVWREKDGTMKEECFVDMTVYTRNRCFRLPFSSKLGEARPLLPLHISDPVLREVSRDYFFRTILSPPAVELYVLATAVPERGVVCDESFSQQLDQEHQPQDQEHQNVSGKVYPLALAPVPIRLLAKAVEQHYNPERMSGFNVTPMGMVTFPMIKHDCEICNDTHNNQCYAVADLKTRTFHSKCHADRSKSGPDVPFPESLGPLSLAMEDELDKEGCFFPAKSSTARMVVGFVDAIYSSARRTAPSIPRAADVYYDGSKYEVKLPKACALDQGAMVLSISLTKLVIRCKGKSCASGGKRWERPSHSAKSSGLWNLSFLFPSSVAPSPPASPVGAAVAVVGGGAFPTFAGSLDCFLGQTDLLRALGLAHEVPVSPATYANRLKDWCIMHAKASVSHDSSAAVQSKVYIMGKILLNPLMEACYRECLAVAPTFAYPMQLVPSEGPSTLALALWIHLTRERGYKHDGAGAFFVPTRDEAGRSFYQSTSIAELVASVCTFDMTPNLCTAILWKKGSLNELERCLTTFFPSLRLNKRYVGCADVVYDLASDKTLTWEHVSTAMPFMLVNRPFDQVSTEERAHWRSRFLGGL